MSINHDTAVAIVFDILSDDVFDVYVTYGPQSPDWLKETAQKVVMIINNQVIANNAKKIELKAIQ